ncbi:unnamed protein product [Rhizophagus irregularis]|nr:unnamed protein product [Rhizophagus irregularis]
MGLIAEENSDGSHMTKRNHNNASVGREASDATSTTILKPSWKKPDINVHFAKTSHFFTQHYNMLNLAKLAILRAIKSIINKCFIEN